MKKAVAISGSPRTTEDSNTNQLIKEFFRLLKEKNNALEMEIVTLSHCDVKPCSGCMACTNIGKCPIEDDVDDIRDLMSGADLIILASPVHFNHVSSVFQNFVERSLLDLHTFKLIGKPSIHMVTTNGSGEQDALSYLNKIGLLYGTINIGRIAKLDNEKFEKKPLSKLAEKTNAVLAGNIKLKPGFMNSLYFSSMKKIIRENPSYFAYEMMYWSEKGLFDKSYRKIVRQQ